MVHIEHGAEFEGWRAAFSDPYIDPYHNVKELADILRRNITDFCNHPTRYVAPYTCIVTSS